MNGISTIGTKLEPKFDHCDHTVYISMLINIWDWHPMLTNIWDWLPMLTNIWDWLTHIWANIHLGLANTC